MNKNVKRIYKSMFKFFGVNKSANGGNESRILYFIFN